MSLNSNPLTFFSKVFAITAKLPGTKTRRCKTTYMKIPLAIWAALLCVQPAHAQLKKSAACPVFNVDVLSGKLNDNLNPQSTSGEVQKMFPCFTDLQEKPATGQCAGIFYKDKGIYFYTDRDYIEIRENFKGKLSLPLLGAGRKSLFKWLGNPVMKDVNWDAYRLKYGTLVLYYNKAGRVNKLQLSNKSTETLKLCE
jgi:hypothetical protein